MAKKNAKSTQPTVYRIPIEWCGIENAPVVFSNHMMVQLDEHECYLSFFELKPPLIVGEEAEKAEQLKNITGVRATCKVQIVISKDRMGIFAAAMQEIANRIKAKQKDGDKPANGKQDN